MNELQQIIEQAWEDRASLSPGKAPARIGDAVDHVLNELDSGKLRVAERIAGEWTTHQWIKKAVLLSFRLEDNTMSQAGPMRYFDKVPTKFDHYDAQRFNAGGFR
ncbi:MAG: 2,3,4,5-tetrahydropyridine-2,6-dicarboxylate N-succinyltransferase, partial [Sulfuritalea sp.]|nr:2,3,4,5-tetrahydropyridine-2,6-dicarboxylate N-succinyltransferase [Sulfuritalea sp.]